MRKDKKKIFLFVRSPAASRASLMAKIRASVSNFTCKGSLVELPLLSLQKIFFLLLKELKKKGMNQIV